MWVGTTALREDILEHGVIGNTTDFGSVISGSNPDAPTKTIIVRIAQLVEQLTVNQ